MKNEKRFDTHTKNVNKMMKHGKNIQKHAVDNNNNKKTM